MDTKKVAVLGLGVEGKNAIKSLKKEDIGYMHQIKIELILRMRK